MKEFCIFIQKNGVSVMVANGNPFTFNAYTIR